jgi:hypothetical protein
MKTLVIMLFVISGGILASAQQVPPPTVAHDLVVVKFDWSKERVGWQQDPFEGPIENFEEMRVRARNEKRIQDAKRGGSGAELSKAERDARTDAALTAQIHQNTPGRYRFLYRLQVHNRGLKAVKAIDWDYIFLDSNTHGEIGRREFRSEASIAPGKTKELKFFLRTPPTKTVSVNSLNKNERANLEEMVVIVRVEYSDGSIWQQP